MVVTGVTRATNGTLGREISGYRLRTAAALARPAACPCAPKMGIGAGITQWNRCIDDVPDA